MADPGTVEDALGKVEALVAVNRLRQAETLARALVAQAPDLANTHSALTGVLARMGRHEESLAPARETLRLDPLNAGHHLRLGNALVETGQPVEALEHAREAVGLAPHEWMCHHMVAQTIVVGGLTDLRAEAFRALAEARRLAPHQATILTLLGVTHAQGGDRDAARTAYRQALELEPGNATVLHNLATLDMSQGNFVRGADGLLSAAAIDPTNPLQRENLQIVRARLGAGFTALWVLAGVVLGAMLVLDTAGSARVVTGLVWGVATLVLTGLAWRSLPRRARRGPRRMADALERSEKILLAAQAVPVLGVATMAISPRMAAIVAGGVVLAYLVIITGAILIYGGDEDD
ncbi:tetratricopeptide repeat protein [Nocardioides sp. AE5]|uniref:tetratricopeptide repeat protein n=1 Tax=Nocardioides sp. AE5 TaxID=2962573 RepID=UPI0028816B8E|nr:tetratricopeptide repeat protein [Nocardioides sp. AE5]MDT0200324.1 tetratricopeptide repeat protein [Nocardioides sp. AE5]